MSGNPLFEQTVTALLGGEVICEYSYDDLYNYLLLPENQQRVAEFLNQLNRTLRKTGSGEAWVCAYEDISSPDAKEAVRQQFSMVANNLEPIVQFLRLVMAIEGSQRPIAPGDPVHESVILDRLSSVPSLESKLRALTETQYFKTTKTDSAGQIRKVMTTLEKAGYLKSRGTTGSVYQATGKWGWLYDMMTFIQTHEGIRESGSEEDPQLRLS